MRLILHLLRGPLAAVLCLGLAAPVSAQRSYSDYQRRLEASRRHSLDAYQQWQRDRLNRYEQLRSRDAVADGGLALDLGDADIPAGSYDLQLPLGLRFRVNVQDGDVPPRGGWVDASYRELHHLSRQLEEEVRNIHIILHNAGLIDEYMPEIGYARESLDELTEAIEDREDSREIGLLFQQFDERWHPLAYELQSRYGPTTSIGRRVASVQSLDDRFHRLVNIAPSAVYDRIRVAALTSQLAETTHRLVDELSAESRRSPALRGSMRQARRVERHAEDLHDTVVRGAHYGLVLDEYEQFDAAWHRLLDRARGNPQIDRYIRDIGRDVWTLDRALHEELAVGAPLVNDSQRTASLAESVAMTAEHLAYELRSELRGTRRGEVLDAAENFTLAARNLREQLAANPDPDAARRELRQAREWWEYLDAQLRGLDRSRFEHALQIAGQLDEQMSRLERSIG